MPHSARLPREATAVFGQQVDGPGVDAPDLGEAIERKMGGDATPECAMPTDEEIRAQRISFGKKRASRRDESTILVSGRAGAAAQRNSAQSAGRLCRLIYDQAPFRFPAHFLERVRLSLIQSCQRSRIP